MREVDRPAVVGVDEALVPELGALVDVGDAGHGQRDQLGGQRVAAGGSVDPVRELAEDRGHPLVVERRVDGARARRTRTPRRARPRWSGRRPRASPSRRTRAGGPATRGQAPSTACHSSDPKAGSGSGASRSSSSSADSHSSGISARTAIRARASSLRLVSCVVEAVIACGQSCLPPRHRVVELRDRHREDARVAADLVERGQPRVAVERAVLDALGHHHPARLLEAQRRRVPAVAQQRLDPVEGGVEVGPPAAGVGERVVEVGAAVGQVGAVDREAGEQLGDRVDEGRRLGPGRRHPPARSGRARSGAPRGAARRRRSPAWSRGSARPSRPARPAARRARSAAPHPRGR